MKCKCGEQAELKIFNTFQYYYCNKCKAEIEIEEPKKEEENPNNFGLDDFYLSMAPGKSVAEHLQHYLDILTGVIK